MQALMHISFGTPRPGKMEMTQMWSLQMYSGFGDKHVCSQTSIGTPVPDLFAAMQFPDSQMYGLGHVS
jgi:hypothetical protein